jgi:hypothetical protein
MSLAFFLKCQWKKFKGGNRVRKDLEKEKMERW